MYACNPKYFVQSVVHWLYKAYARKIKVDVYVKDLDVWDAMLWNRHLFLPHTIVRITEYDRIRLLSRESLSVIDKSSKTVVICEPNEVAKYDVESAVWFVAQHDFTCKEVIVYQQSESGKWTLVD